MKIENFANNFESICTVSFGTNGNGFCWVDETDTETKEELLNTEFDYIEPLCNDSCIQNAREWLVKHGWDADAFGTIDDETLKKLTIAVKEGKDSQGFYNGEKWAIIY